MSSQAMKRHRGDLSAYHLSERSQSEKTTYCMIPTLWYFGKGKTIETRQK